jgi:hypothetical protein
MTGANDKFKVDYKTSNIPNKSLHPLCGQNKPIQITRVQFVETHIKTSPSVIINYNYYIILRDDRRKM